MANGVYITAGLSPSKDPDKANVPNSVYVSAGLPPKRGAADAGGGIIPLTMYHRKMTRNP